MAFPQLLIAPNLADRLFVNKKLVCQQQHVKFRELNTS